MRFKNMEECECDRCGSKEFLQLDSPNQSEWHDMQRITADGADKPFLLCQKCFNAYRDFMQLQDKEFVVWMEGK